MTRYVGGFRKYVRRDLVPVAVCGECSVVVSCVLLGSEALKDDFCVYILKIFNISRPYLFRSLTEGKITKTF